MPHHPRASRPDLDVRPGYKPSSERQRKNCLVHFCTRAMGAYRPSPAVLLLAPRCAALPPFGNCSPSGNIGPTHFVVHLEVLSATATQLAQRAYTQDMSVAPLMAPTSAPRDSLVVLSPSTSSQGRNDSSLFHEGCGQRLTTLASKHRL